MRSWMRRMVLWGMVGCRRSPGSGTPAASQTPLSVTVCHTQDIGLIDPARGVLLNELNNLWVQHVRNPGCSGSQRSVGPERG